MANGSFKNASEFRGYMQGKMEGIDKTFLSIDKTLKSIKSHNEKQDIRMDTLDKDLSFVKGKMVMIVTGVTAAVSAAVAWIIDIWRN